MEGDDDTAFAEDYFSEHSARPADGCLLELELLPSELEVGLAISDAAQWLSRRSARPRRPSATLGIAAP